MNYSLAIDVLRLASEEGEPSPLKPHTSELIIGIVAFVLLFLFLRAKVFPVFERTYRERREGIQGGLERAETAQREAQRTLEEYKAQLADARNEAARIREEARSQGQGILDEMRMQSQTEAARILERAEEQLANERQQTITELRREVGQIAMTLAERIVGESLQDDARATRTVDRFLADLESTPRDEVTTGGGPDRVR